MKYLSTILLSTLLSFNCLNSQQNLNSYKYVNVVMSQYTNGGIDVYGIGTALQNYLASNNFILYNQNDNTMQRELMNNPCLLTEVQYRHTFDSVAGITVSIQFKNCKGSVVFANTGKQFIANDTPNYYLRALKKAFKPISDYNYRFDVSRVIKFDYPVVEKTNENESSLTQYYDTNKLSALEGIYKSTETNGFGYKIGIKKDGYKYKAIILESDYSHWKIGEVKAVFEETATPNVYSCRYYMSDKSDKEVFVVHNLTGLLEIELDNQNKASFVKLYPKIDNKNNRSQIKTTDGWAGNGSGIIISKSGYIITNNHVIEDASKIEVEFIINNEVQKLNAEVVQVDKINDLAILKIFDMNFDGLSEIKYNFKTRSSDVGTKIYAYGYPEALTIMGKDIKITDGIISSKAGLEGDITSYQISATIQPGNSGGPLFDDKGNFIGINSAGLARLGQETVGYSKKSNYVLNLIDALPKSINLPTDTSLESLPLTEQIKEISKYVVLVKVK